MQQEIKNDKTDILEECRKKGSPKIQKNTEKEFQKTHEKRILEKTDF